jgi:hypothetical protein
MTTPLERADAFRRGGEDYALRVYRRPHKPKFGTIFCECALCRAYSAGWGHAQQAMREEDAA